MNKYLMMFMVTLTFILGGCSEDEELQKTIFVKDDSYPQLPRYSESGYNTFGAFYDREAFTSSAKTPMKVVVTGESTRLSFNGTRNWNNEMSITIKIAGFYPSKYEELLDLGGLVVDLTNPTYKVFIKNGGNEYEAQVLNGKVDFKNAKSVIVDKKQVEVILSGTFDFQAFVNGEPITVSKGRFDIGIGSDAFFKN